MHKYRAKRCTFGGHNFDSKKEMERYIFLLSLEQKGEIEGLELQPKFLLHKKFIDRNGKKHREINYIGDFRYSKNGIIFIEDVKGYKTEVYKMKYKMLLFKYPDINFREV